MRGLDGFEVLKAIRAGNAIRPIHTVIVSAWADLNIYRELASAPGADDMVTKPFRPNQIRLTWIAASRKKLAAVGVGAVAARANVNHSKK